MGRARQRDEVVGIRAHVGRHEVAGVAGRSPGPRPCRRRSRATTVCTADVVRRRASSPHTRSRTTSAGTGRPRRDRRTARTSRGRSPRSGTALLPSPPTRRGPSTRTCTQSCNHTARTPGRSSVTGNGRRNGSSGPSGARPRAGAARRRPGRCRGARARAPRWHRRPGRSPARPAAGDRRRRAAARHRRPRRRPRPRRGRAGRGSSARARRADPRARRRAPRAGPARRPPAGRP